MDLLNKHTTLVQIPKFSYFNHFIHLIHQNAIKWNVYKSNFSHANNISIQIHKYVYRGAMFYGIYFPIHIYTVIIQENCQCGNRCPGSILMKNGYISVTALNQNSVWCTHATDMTPTYELCAKKPWKTFGNGYIGICTV